MAVKHIKVHQIDEQQAVKILVHRLERRLHAGRVARRVVALGDAAVIEDILNLAHAQHVIALVLQNVQHRLADGIDREIATVAGTHKRTGIADERARDHAADIVFTL